jgi:chitinase
MKFAAIAALLLLATSLSEGVLVCYYSSWSAYREGLGKFEIEDIDPFLCTHIVYGFATLNALNRIAPSDRWNDLCGASRNCGYERFTALKQTNPDLKTIISVGGWNDGSTKFSEMVADPTSRATFIGSVLSFLAEHNFDGLDFDWEYPTQRGGVPEDKENFAVILEELSEALHANGFTLSAPVASSKVIGDEAYDIPRISAAVDFIHLMTYDFHGPWETNTHHHTILHAYPEDSDGSLYLNVDYAVNYWLEQGASADKLVMGAATYGRTWTLDDPAEAGMYAPASLPGSPGNYTRSPGTLAYNEFCELNMDGSWTIVREEDMNEPYAYDLAFGNTWSGFDDSESISAKASYALSQNLAGVLVWSLDLDDFRGTCSGTQFPLVQSLKATFSGDASTPHAYQLMKRIETRPAARPKASEHCTQPGNNAEPLDCTIYYKCDVEDDGSFTEEVAQCPQGTLFNPESRICDRVFAVCALNEEICPNECGN